VGDITPVWERGNFETEEAVRSLNLDLISRQKRVVKGMVGEGPMRWRSREDTGKAGYPGGDVVSPVAGRGRRGRFS